MMIEVMRERPDRLQREVYTFFVDADPRRVFARLSRYKVQTRKTTRHKFVDSALWDSAFTRDSTVHRASIVVPQEIRDEAARRIAGAIQVDL